MFKVRGASSFRSHLLVVQNQNEIYPTIPKDPINYYKTCTARKKFINTIISFLPIGNAKKPIPALYHCRSPHFTIFPPQTYTLSS